MRKIFASLVIFMAIAGLAWGMEKAGDLSEQKAVSS